MALIFRTIRWRVLLASPKPPGFYPTFFANTTGYMLSTVLPIRAGDVARPALLARRTNVRFAEALGTVLTERILDLFSILALFIWFAAMRWNAFPNERRRRARRRDRLHDRSDRAAVVSRRPLLFRRRQSGACTNGSAAFCRSDSASRG